MKPRLLDLFCGAGGAAMGYHRAGFEVVGVDIAPQPRYPFAFVQMDALDFLNGGWFWAQRMFGDPAYGPFDAIHASPPCQFATDYKRTGNVAEHENLIPATRELLKATGLPYVIENVEKAKPWLHVSMKLCGSMFDLDVQRHRLFEFNWTAEHPHEPAFLKPCRHKIWADNRYPGATNRKGRRTVEIGVWRIPLETQQKAMGIDWMTTEELSEAIPPAYTEYIGHQLLAHLKAQAVA